MGKSSIRFLKPTSVTLSPCLYSIVCRFSFSLYNLNKALPKILYIEALCIMRSCNFRNQFPFITVTGSLCKRHSPSLENKKGIDNKKERVGPRTSHRNVILKVLNALSFSFLAILPRNYYGGKIYIAVC